MLGYLNDESVEGVKGTIDFDETKLDGIATLNIKQEYNSTNSEWEDAEGKEVIKYSLKDDTLYVTFDSNEDGNYDEGNLFGNDNYDYTKDPTYVFQKIQ